MSDATATTSETTPQETIPTPQETITAVAALASSDPTTVEARLAADEVLLAAVMRHALADALWIERVIGALRNEGVTVTACNRLRSTIRREVKDQQRAIRAGSDTLHAIDPDAPPPLVRDALSDAPVHEEAVIPPGYRLSRTGIIAVKGVGDEVRHVPVAPDPVLITTRLRESATGDEWVTVTWWQDHTWREITVRRSQIASSTEIVKLSDSGLAVSSNSARDLVGWFSAYEALNRCVTPLAHVSSQMGWQGPSGEGSFLSGRTLITATEIDAGANAAGIIFRGNDAGDDELADGLVPAGTLAGWKDIVALIAPYPRARLGLYASLAAPLLDILGVSTFFVDYCSQTSRGKTTTMRLAASVWGQPDPAQPGSMVGTWNKTLVSAERRAALLHSLPVVLDDSKQASSREFVGKTIFNLAAGQERGRGSLTGQRRTRHWRTVILTTGEGRLVDFTQDGGARARVLTVWGGPFGAVDATTESVVARLTIGLTLHHGHAGPAFVTFLLQHREQWDTWRQVWRAETQAHIDRDPGNAVAGRLGGYLAAISLAASLAHEAELLPFSYADAVADVREDILRHGEEADRGQAALYAVAGWLTANEEGFHGRDGGNNAPPGGWLGRWELRPWDNVAIIPHHLEDFLTRQGFDYDAVVRDWREREWLEVDAEKDGTPRNQKRVRIGSDSSPRCIVIRRDALDLDLDL